MKFVFIILVIKFVQSEIVCPHLWTCVNVFETDPKIESTDFHGYLQMTNPERRHLFCDRDLFAHLPTISDLRMNDITLVAVAPDCLKSLPAIVNSMDLKDNYLPEISWDLLPKKLQILSLKNNQLTIISRFDTPFEDLTFLDLSNNRLIVLYNTNFEVLFPRLSKLDLSGNQLITLKIRSSSLRSLDISYNSNIKEFNLETPNLYELKMRKSFKRNGNPFPKLMSLNLQENQITNLLDIQMQNYPKLESLLLDENNFGSLEIVNDYSLPYLLKFSCMKCKLVQIDKNLFSSHFPNVESVFLANNYLTTVNIFHSDGHKRRIPIEKLDLSHNLIEEIEMIVFKFLVKLKFLDLSHNHIKSINNLFLLFNRNVFSVNLSHNRIFELDPGAFSTVTYLNINHNRLNYLVPQENDWPNMTKIELHGNPWQCSCLFDLEKWFQRKRIFIAKRPHQRKRPICLKLNTGSNDKCSTNTTLSEILPYLCHFNDCN